MDYCSVCGISEKRRRIGNLSLFACIFVLTTAYFHFYSWYSLLAPYGTLTAAVFLTVTFFCYVDLSYALRDPVFYLMIFTDLLALVHLLLVHSHMGAILTVADFLLILYLSNKLMLSQKEILVSSAYLGVFFLYWTIDVKGYFKGYNTNYGGLVLISGFIFLIFFWELMISRHRKGLYVMRVVEIFLFALAFNIIAWYRSRCALIGLVVFLALMLLPAFLWKNRVLYGLLSFGATFGAVLFSLLYVFLGKNKDVFTVQLYYKDIISGREAVWSELWQAYLRQPFTGIGSAYQMQLEEMNGLFEVHSGLLDILIVHGLIVFLITCTFLVFRLFFIRERCASEHMAKTAMAGIFAMLFTAFLENYIIVAPFCLMFLLLFGYAGAQSHR
ncbi:MAG: O-antigen ligase family protein [Lachnospiraceae bacterium]|nr:O-antigen ligase family protein [Lachnospiraceae bacterium]